MKGRSDELGLYLFVQHVGRRLRHIDAAYGLSSSRVSAMAHLAFHGVDNVGQLAAHEGVSRPSMTRLVRDMESDGLVRRSPDANDGRGVLVALTKKGRALVEKIRTEKIALIAAHVNTLDPAARRALRLTLENLHALETAKN